MGQSQRDRAEAALSHANKLLSGNWRPPLYKRVKWWNLALFGVVLVAGFSIVGPLVHPDYRNGFSGNLVSSAWQLMAGGLAGWIVYKRFMAERFKRAMPLSWADAFTEMGDISLKLYLGAIGEAVDLRNALNSQLRNRLTELALAGRQKGAMFSRFFEIEQIADIDQACSAAESLAAIDDGLADSKFMTTAINAIWHLHVSPAKVRGYSPSLSIMQQLNGVSSKWEALEEQRLRSESLVKVAAQKPVSH